MADREELHELGRVVNERERLYQENMRLRQLLAAAVSLPCKADYAHVAAGLAVLRANSLSDRPNDEIIDAALEELTG